MFDKRMYLILTAVSAVLKLKHKRLQWAVHINVHSRVRPVVIFPTEKCYWESFKEITQLAKIKKGKLDSSASFSSYLPWISWENNIKSQIK